MTIDQDMIWFKVTWVLGIDDLMLDVKEFFASGKGYRTLVKDLLEAFEKEEWETAKRLFKRLLGIFKSNEFEEWLIKKIGKKAAEAALGNIAKKFLPIFGWLITAGMIVAAIIGQFIE